ALDAARHELIAALVGEQLKQYGGDPQASLAALSSLDDVRDELHQIGDPDLAASLGPSLSSERDEPGSGATSRRRAGRRCGVHRPHAEGGRGRVYEAEDQELGRRVALKEIKPAKADEPLHRSRFVQEAEIKGGLQHPAIVPVYSLGSYDDGKPF